MFKRKKTYDLPQNTKQSFEHESQDSAVHKTVLNKLKKPCCKSYTGIFYIFISSISILLTNTLVKKLSYIDPAQLSIVRHAGSLLGNLPIAIYCTSNILGPREQFWWLNLRSFIGATAWYLNFMAFRLLALADASIILATVPSLVTVTARFYLKEPCGKVQVLSVILTFLGVLISIRIPLIISNGSERFTKTYILGLACAFGCVLTLTYLFISLRVMKNVHFSIILVYLGIWGIVENLIITAFTSTFTLPHCGGWDSVQMILIGVFSLMGHIFMVLSTQAEMAGVISVSKTAIDVIVALIFQILFFNVMPDVYTLSGGALVCVAITLLVLRKWIMTQPEEARCRKKCKWILS